MFIYFFYSQSILFFVLQIEYSSYTFSHFSSFQEIRETSFKILLKKFSLQSLAFLYLWMSQLSVKFLYNCWNSLKPVFLWLHILWNGESRVLCWWLLEFCVLHALPAFFKLNEVLLLCFIDRMFLLAWYIAYLHLPRHVLVI